MHSLCGYSLEWQLQTPFIVRVLNFPGRKRINICTAMHPFSPTLKLLIPKKFSYITENDIDKLTRNRIQDWQYRKFCRKVRRHLERTPIKNIYYEGKRKCWYPWCREKRVYKLTKDHIVPIAVAYYLNWTIEETKSYRNLQLLCVKHHAKKDKNVKSLQDEVIIKNNYVIPASR